MKLFVALLFMCSALFAMDNNQTIEAIFKNSEAVGTFVLYDPQQERYIVHNPERAKQRFVPASTFKIANSLIGLATGSVKSVDEVLPYKGSAKPFLKQWKHDMSLRSAIAMSNVPIYQELARRIGLERMKENVKRLGYGNENIGTHVTRFWLDGPLKISALEQVAFLTRLTRHTLPYPKAMQQSVESIVLLEETPQWRLFGKTGWYSAKEKGIGWFVGWLETSGHTYVFALNIDMNDVADAKKRMALAKESLKALGLIKEV